MTLRSHVEMGMVERRQAEQRQQEPADSASRELAEKWKEGSLCLQVHLLTNAHNLCTHDPGRRIKFAN